MKSLPLISNLLPVLTFSIFIVKYLLCSCYQICKCGSYSEEIANICTITYAKEKNNTSYLFLHD